MKCPHMSMVHWVCLLCDICSLVGFGTSVSWLHTEHPEGLSDTGICACLGKVAETWKKPCIKENEDKERYKL